MPAVSTCGWCGARFEKSGRRGRPRRFCRPSHRQRAYEARLLAERMGLGSDEVLVGRADWGSWRDRLYVLETALEDVEADLRGRAGEGDYRAAFRHLYAAAAPLRETRLEPRALGEGRP